MTDRNTEPLLTAELTNAEHDVALLRLVGEVDLSSAHLLTGQFETLAKNRPPRVVIDATSVSFMDSTGLHALVEGKRLIHENGTRIVLVPSPQVRRVLDLVFPDPLFAARLDTVDEALRHLDGIDEDTPTGS